MDALCESVLTNSGVRHIEQRSTCNKGKENAKRPVTKVKKTPRVRLIKVMSLITFYFWTLKHGCPLSSDCGHQLNITKSDWGYISGIKDILFSNSFIHSG